MIDAKIQFSENELNLAADIDFILTKNRIIEKVYSLFGLLAGTYVKLGKDLLPQETASNSPKISRGENYKGLPYVMLDYPRFFTREDVLAIRTMFWWGNDLSITLHLKGKFKPADPAMFFKLNESDPSSWYLQLSDDEWLHHKTAISHKRVIDLTSGEMNNLMIRKTPFVKIARFYPLQQWCNADKFFEKSFSSLIQNL
ncbi:hypothetical protein DC498_02115 [Terrimonas sp.]|uniref:hypothetical protein n=1 Tax=Terrimonas sp. TaxID=1914338 RepID=UPI000D517FA2|nr:hypothetical protein [Terrimonas sp.]PVD54199.1 hypothetical protein DC498_02115 [Terrimonas sp.]